MVVMSKKRRAAHRAILAAALDSRAAAATPQPGDAGERRARLRQRLEARWAAQKAAATAVTSAAAALPEEHLALWRDFAQASELDTAAVAQEHPDFDIHCDFFGNPSVGSVDPRRNAPADKRYASMTFSYDVEAASLAKRHKSAHTSPRNAYPDANSQ